MNQAAHHHEEVAQPPTEETRYQTAVGGESREVTQVAVEQPKEEAKVEVKPPQQVELSKPVEQAAPQQVAMLSTNQEINFEKRGGVPPANEKPNNAPNPLP